MRWIALAALLLLPACDKAMHGAVGFGISSFVAEATGIRELGCAASAVAGVAKEMIDPIPDPFDIAATIAGGCAATEAVRGL